MSAAFDSPPLFQAIEALYRADEAACLRALYPAASLGNAARAQAVGRATRWITEIRRHHKPAVSITDLLTRFGLSSQEGVALMCLAEALLRIPDSATADALIRDKLSAPHWHEALGDHIPWAMNVTGWALVVTGKIANLDDPEEQHPATMLGKLLGRVGQPVVREAIRAAMGWMADQFVMGETIDDALRRAAPHAAKGTRFSYDMLGEGARTAVDAQRFYDDYVKAIDTVGKHQAAHNHPRASGVSIKLSALHPRYEMAQRERVLKELTPRLVALCEQAARYDIPLTIDAEEAERLYLALEVFAALLDMAQLGEWEGLGFAVQAYEKRAPAVVDFFIALAIAHKRKLGIRLVKGAYWDTEIKRAQERGWDDFSVFTRKPATDVSYFACARRMLDCVWIKPVFGTHNAMTVAHILEIARVPSRIEFQRLHGMGEDLHRLMQNDGIACCVYAPVGDHNVLLGYLVRRLLENGANSSFVHRLHDPSVPVKGLVADPVETLKGFQQLSHPRIRRAPDLFLPERTNSHGLDLTDPFVTEPLLNEIGTFTAKRYTAHPVIHRNPEPSPSPLPQGERSLRGIPEQSSSPPAGEVRWGGVPQAAPSPHTSDPNHQASPPLPQPLPQGEGSLRVYSPANHSHCLGEIVESTDEQVASAFANARRGFAHWQAVPVTQRAAIIERLGTLLEQNRAELMALLINEAGKTVADALAEIREATDFCRYYAARARVDFTPLKLAGPTGEENTLTLHGRGVFACISPWNFPIAIFIGQIAAALVTGNSVIAKPAPQTPLIAACVTRLIHAAGVPTDVFQLLLGGAAIGNTIIAHPALAGVAFTGSTATALGINRALAQKDGPIVPFIAETGGQNALILDSSALPEQVIDDVIASAFRSAGQRCSALRILCVPTTTADKILALLKGALMELRVGDPALLATDVGPVIDKAAQQRLTDHVALLRREAKEIATLPLDDSHAQGTFVAPQIWEIPAIGWLKGEVFGPILHVVRYDPAALDPLIAAINATGFGLTGGIHSRIAATIRHVERALQVGNFYVNRAQIGAIVGAQPFGGEGISGTGPKAGGPHYLARFATERVTANNLAAAGGNASLLLTAGEDALF